MFEEYSMAIKVVVFNLLYIPLVNLLLWLDLSAVQLVILAILLAFDFITGVFKVIVIKGSLRSCRAMAGILTKISVMIMVFALALMAKGLNMNFEIYISTFISLLILSETYSIVGNVYSIKTKEEVAEFDAVAMTIKKVRVTIEKLLMITRNEI